MVRPNQSDYTMSTIHTIAMILTMVLECMHWMKYVHHMDRQTIISLALILVLKSLSAMKNSSDTSRHTKWSRVFRYQLISPSLCPTLKTSLVWIVVSQQEHPIELAKTSLNSYCLFLIRVSKLSIHLQMQPLLQQL